MFEVLLPDYLGESIPLGVLLALDFGSLAVWTSNLTVSMQQKLQLSLVIIAGMILLEKKSNIALDSNDLCKKTKTGANKDNQQTIKISHDHIHSLTHTLYSK